MRKQKTIKQGMKYSGIGLHTGESSNIVFKPAPENTGVRFVRTDLPDYPVIEATIANVIGVIRGTTIGRGDVRVHTIEHIMAALCALEIDNIIIEIDANEPPVGDGSALPFIKTLSKAGIEEQQADKKYARLSEPVEYIEGDIQLLIVPSEEFKISCTISYNHPVLGTEFFSCVINQDVFTKEIAPSRTFCFDYEIEVLKREGLARGGSLDNAIVIGEKKIHNTSLRFPDEFVRHKVLDIIGDLYLLGKPIKGHVIAHKTGHAANIAFSQKIAEHLANPPKSTIASSNTLPQGRLLDVQEIKSIIPHRYPFLLVDKVVVTEEQKKAVGFKNVTANEDFFNGHFPVRPVMPGVLILEAMAQTSCVLFLSKNELRNKLAFFMGINEAKFRKPVVPGDCLRFEVEVVRARARGGKVMGKAYVESSLVAEAEFMFSLVDK